MSGVQPGWPDPTKPEKARLKSASQRRRVVIVVGIIVVATGAVVGTATNILGGVPPAATRLRSRRSSE